MMEFDQVNLLFSNPAEKYSTLNLFLFGGDNEIFQKSIFS